MKKILTVLALLIGFYVSQAQDTIQAQKVDEDLLENTKFTGATTTKNTYKAIYQLDSNDPQTIKKAFRNIKNALQDERLKNKLTIHLITFSGGTEVMRTNSLYIADIKALIRQGVQVSQCTNSLKERNLTRADILPFIAYVPSGNGELIIRASEGWAVIKP